MMLETVYKNSAKNFTVGQALEMYKLGISVAVNDGKDLTITFEESEINGNN